MKTLVHIPNLEGGTTFRSNYWFPSLLDHFFDSFPVNYEEKDQNCNWVPSTNIKENEKDFSLEIAVPGVSKNNIHVSVDNGVITITGENKTARKEEKEGYRLREYCSGSFKRSFTLPKNVNVDAINAKHEDGVLTLNIPKEAEVVNPAKEIKIS